MTSINHPLYRQIATDGIDLLNAEPTPEIS